MSVQQAWDAALAFFTMGALLSHYFWMDFGVEL
jgi:hypothetical protein